MRGKRKHIAKRESTSEVQTELEGQRGGVHRKPKTGRRQKQNRRNIRVRLSGNV